MKTRTARLVRSLPVLIAAGSLAVSLAAYRVSSKGSAEAQKEKDVQRRLQQHGTQVDKRAKITRTLREFRSLSLLYLFAEAESEPEHPRPELEARHVEYHRLEAELVSLVETIASSFGPCVGATAADFAGYLHTYPWEQRIQEYHFHEKLRADHSGSEGVNDMIYRAIFLDQFDHFATQLERHMDKEMVATTDSPNVSAQSEWWDPPCENVVFTPEIDASSHEAQLNEPVTFRIKWPRDELGDQYMYSIDWNVDEGHKGDEVPFEVSFTQPGIKLVTATVYVMRRVKNGERSQIVKYVFLRDEIKVALKDPVP